MHRTTWNIALSGGSPKNTKAGKFEGNSTLRGNFDGSGDLYAHGALAARKLRCRNDCLGHGQGCHHWPWRRVTSAVVDGNMNNFVALASHRSAYRARAFPKSVDGLGDQGVFNLLPGVHRRGKLNVMQLHLFF